MTPFLERTIFDPSITVKNDQQLFGPPLNCIHSKPKLWLLSLLFWKYKKIKGTVYDDENNRLKEDTWLLKK